MTPEEFNDLEFASKRVTKAMIVQMVKLFQHDHKLADDGKFGEATRKALATRYDEQYKPAIPVYTVKDWDPYINALSGGYGVSGVFARKWIEVESGGNPAAIGAPGDFYNGHPREIGIAQFYNPDDLARLGLKIENLRAYCDGNTQKLTRALTDAEMKEQVVGLLKLVKLCQTSAYGILAAVGNPKWSYADLQKLTKLVHGLPGLAYGVKAVMRYLGRAPSSWDEFRANINNVTLDAGTERYRPAFARILQNAETTGNAL